MMGNDFGIFFVSAISIIHVKIVRRRIERIDKRMPKEKRVPCSTCAGNANVAEARASATLFGVEEASFRLTRPKFSFSKEFSWRFRKASAIRRTVYRDLCVCPLNSSTLLEWGTKSTDFTRAHHQRHHTAVIINSIIIIVMMIASQLITLGGEGAKERAWSFACYGFSFGPGFSPE
uniref:Uncharacterized protein n=1 Tax=Anopheles culicifacies TaxID=139723 RepID=A0A182MJI4_9DIPT